MPTLQTLMTQPFSNETEKLISETPQDLGEQSVYLQDRDKTISMPSDMDEHDVRLNLGVHEYDKPAVPEASQYFYEINKKPESAIGRMAKSALTVVGLHPDKEEIGNQAVMTISEIERVTNDTTLTPEQQTEQLGLIRKDLDGYLASKGVYTRATQNTGYANYLLNVGMMAAGSSAVIRYGAMAFIKGLVGYTIANEGIKRAIIPAMEYTMTPDEQKYEYEPKDLSELMGLKSTDPAKMAVDVAQMGLAGAVQFLPGLMKSVAVDKVISKNLPQIEAIFKQHNIPVPEGGLTPEYVKFKTKESPYLLSGMMEETKGLGPLKNLGERGSVKAPGVGPEEKPTGEGKVYYTGGKELITDFTQKKTIRTGEEKLGTHFTTSEGYAKTFAGKEGKITSVNLDIKKPYNITKENELLIEAPYSHTSFIKELKEKGYDAIVLKGQERASGQGTHDQVFVLDPSIIKLSTPTGQKPAVAVDQFNSEIITASKKTMREGEGLQENIARTKDWISSVLSNDEASTDAELVDYFQKEGGFSKEVAEYIVSKREQVGLLPMGIKQEMKEPTGQKPPVEPPKTAVKVEPPLPEKIKKTRGFVKSVQEELPQLKVSGQYIPRDTDTLSIKAVNLIKDNIQAAERMAAQGIDDNAVAVGAQLLKHYTNEAANAKSPAVQDALYEKAAELANSMAVRLTEAGRTVQAASILSRMTPEGQVRFAARTIQKYNAEVDRIKGGIGGLKKKIPELTPKQTQEIVTEMQRIQAMADGEEKAIAFRDLQNKISDLVPTPIWQKMVAVWKAGLLTGVKTSGVNIISNAVHGALETAKDVPAAAFDMVASLFTGKRTSGVDVTKMFTKEGFKKGWRFLKTGYDERNVLTGLDYKRINMGSGKVAKGIQAYEEAIFKLMGAEDQPFYYAVKARSLGEQAQVGAINAGLKGKEAKTFAKNLFENPTEDMLILATSDAETAVFQNKTALGEVARYIKNMPSTMPGGPAISTAAEIVAPFSKTPSAVAMQIINYSPVGAVRTIATSIGKGKFNQRAFSKQMGRATLGVLPLVVGAYLYREGMLNLDRPTSEAEQKLWEAEGRSPNTVKIGGKWRQIQVLGPAGPLFLIGGQFQKGFDKTGSVTGSAAEFLERTGSGLATAVTGGAKSFTEQTFLKGTNQLVSTISDPTRYGDSMAGSMISSVVPTIVADVAKATDPMVRRSESIWQRIEERIPGLRQTLQPRIGTFGEEAMRKENFFEVMADPTRPTTEIQDPIIGEIRRLVDNKEQISFSQVGDKKGYKVLTQEQNTELWQRAGQVAYDKITSLMQSNDYQNMTDQQRSKIINSFISKAKTVARVEKLIEITTGLQGEELVNKMRQAKRDGLMTQEVFNEFRKVR